MQNLNEDDFRVLIRIETKGLPIDMEKIPEYPNIKKEKIKKSAEALAGLGLIIRDKDMWTVTYEGEQLLQKQQERIRPLYDEILASGLDKNAT